MGRTKLSLDLQEVSFLLTLAPMTPDALRLGLPCCNLCFSLNWLFLGVSFDSYKDCTWASLITRKLTS